MKTILIDDFSGGINVIDNQAVIANNECVTGTQNVWAPNGLLTKTPGCSIFASYTATSTGTVLDVFSEYSTNESYGLYSRISGKSVSTAGTVITTSTGYLHAGSNDTLICLGYTTGTISISGANLISATGSGTLWSSHVTAGDILSVDSSSSLWYPVLSIEDNTHLTLSTALTVAVATGSAYRISLGIGTGNETFGHATLNGSIIMTTTADMMQRYDGTGMTRLSAGPSAVWLAVYKSYMFAGRTATNQSRISWSAINDPTSWPTNNFADIDKARGKISGVFAFGNELMIFKTHSLFKLVATDIIDPANPTYNIYPISVPNYFTFNAGNTIADVNGRLLFYSHGSLFQYLPGTFFVTNVSRKYFKFFPSSLSNINNAYGFDTIMRGMTFKDYYIMKGIRESTSNTTIASGMILDQNKAFWYMTDANQSLPATPMDNTAWTVYTTASSFPSVLTAGGFPSKKPRVYTWDFLGPTFTNSMIDTETAGALAISSTWVSKEFNIEYGTFKWLIIYLQKQTAGNLTVKWSIDQAANVSNTVDMTVGRGTIIRSVLPINQKGTSIQITLSHNTASQTFAVYGIKIYYEDSDKERLL